MGLIGENGAGKSTTIKLLLGLAGREEGEISLLGNSGGELSGTLKENIGVVMDDCCFPEILTAKQVGNVLRSIYKHGIQKIYGVSQRIFPAAGKERQGFFPRDENEAFHCLRTFARYEAVNPGRGNQRAGPGGPG